jgi:putative SOS response-associated peptidase YedK
MDPREYFEKHPDRYWISLGGASLFLLLALWRVAKSEGGWRRFGALLLAVAAGAEVRALVAVRPAESGRLP